MKTLGIFMKITFYGYEGLESVSGKELSQFGGDTACILLTFNNGRIAILDAGTGTTETRGSILRQKI